VRGAIGPSLGESGGSSGHPAEVLLFVLAVGAVATILFAAGARQTQSRR